MSTILNRNIWFWRTYRGSSRQFKTLQNKLILSKIKPFTNSYVASLVCPSFSSKQNDVSIGEEKKFQGLIFDRRKQAHCSVIVETNSYYSLSCLFNLVEETAKVKRIFYRKRNSEKEYFLIECERLSDVRSLLKKCKYSDSPDSIPVFSRILRFNDNHVKEEKNLQIPCEICDTIKERTINKILLESQSVTEQMKELQRCEQLSELDTRLHFFICSQIEDCINSLFPNSICLPFGSAVNGFGCAAGDLDMNLKLNGKQNADDSLLSFIPKRTLANNRFQEQRMLETVGDMLQTFVPGISRLLRILKARIPILKFQHDVIGTQCDMTMNNMSGVYMAEILYLYGEMNPCVRPLVYTIRRWARKNELTSDGASSKITNFSLILMILFYLQTRYKPILPPICKMKCSVETAQVNIVESGNLNECLNDSNVDTSDLESLLMDFFLFYATFNFEQAICLVTGTTTPKRTYSSLYIHNPIEADLNVSKNVANPELKKVIDAARNAIWQLENSFDSNNKHEPWGIMKLFNKQKISPNEEFNRRFHISSLFEKKKTGFSTNHSPLEKQQHYVETNETNKQVKSRNKLFTQKRKYKT